MVIFREYGLNHRTVPGEYVLCPDCAARYKAGRRDHIVEIEHCDKRNDPICAAFWGELAAAYALA
jgi:hypothetical protein